MVNGQPAGPRGTSVTWTVSAWTVGGSLPDASVSLRADPVAGETPAFSRGCGRGDGTSSCDLGAVSASAPHRRLQVKLTVPAAAAPVTSVRLTVTGSAALLARPPSASAGVASPSSSHSAAAAGRPAPGGGAAPTGPASTRAAPAQGPARQPGATQPPGSGRTPGIAPRPAATVARLPVPDLPTTGLRESPGGSAAGLFPTLSPKPGADPLGTANARTRPVANTAALPEGAPVIGAQVVGLVALALAFVLTVARLSIRLRSVPGKHAAGDTRPQVPGGSVQQP